jgi:predicted acylesterase/phospholipase RssA
MPEENSLTPQQFTDSTARLLAFLDKKFGEGKPYVSDIRDDLKRQCVDLVQEGGGVYGIALAGYTYILEKMGVAFIKMAGTSAGSINTLLLSAVYTRDEAKLLGLDPSPFYETRSESIGIPGRRILGDIVDSHPCGERTYSAFQCAEGISC